MAAWSRARSEAIGRPRSPRREIPGKRTSSCATQGRNPYGSVYASVRLARSGRTSNIPARPGCARRGRRALRWRRRPSRRLDEHAGLDALDDGGGRRVVEDEDDPTHASAASSSARSASGSTRRAGPCFSRTARSELTATISRSPSCPRRLRDGGCDPGASGQRRRSSSRQRARRRAGTRPAPPLHRGREWEQATFIGLQRSR